jgi:hypothetical protein
MPNNDKGWQKLTFAQRLGVEPLPTPLNPTELSKALRAQLWEIIYRYLCETREGSEVGGIWGDILYRKHVHFDNGMADRFDGHFGTQCNHLSRLFEKGSHIEIYGCLEHILRDWQCPVDFREQLSGVLKDNLAPYVITPWNGFVVTASAEQGELLVRALNEISKSPMAGASQHLKQSIELINKGQWAKSIAESIHAVESVARKIEPTATTLDPALKKLAPKISMHPALQGAFGKLYGYTSDAQGIRHALIDQSTAAVDRDDAIFMLTTCAAFSSYLVNKATGAALL